MKRQIIENTTLYTSRGYATRKKIKDEFFRNSCDISEGSSVLAKSESNDCVVRAFMCVLDINYDMAHKWVKTKFGRVNRKGTYTSRHLSAVIGKVKNGKKLTMYGWSPDKAYSDERRKKLLVNPNYKKQTAYTVKSFMEEHPEGRYFIIVNRHALALVDGVLYGNSNEQYDGFRRRIHYVVKIK